jgi:hypothetical protein
MLSQPGCSPAASFAAFDTDPPKKDSTCGLICVIPRRRPWRAAVLQDFLTKPGGKYAGKTCAVLP